MSISSDSTVSTPDPGVGYLKKVYCYGMLVVLLPLLAFIVHWHMTLPPDYPYDRYSSLVVPVMLLMNHLAFAFTWKKRVTSILRNLSFIVAALGAFYLLNTYYKWF